MRQREPETRLKSLSVWYGVLLAVDVVFAVNFAVAGDSYALPLIACVLLIPLVGFPLLINMLFLKTLQLKAKTNVSRYLALAMMVASLLAILIFYLFTPLYLIVSVLDSSFTFSMWLLPSLLMALTGVVLAVDGIDIFRRFPR